MINRANLRPNTFQTAYELWNGKKPNVKYFRVFGSKCYILRDRESLGKFDSKSDDGIFLGYSTTSRAYRVYNLRTSMFMESANVVVDDTSIDETPTPLLDDDWNIFDIEESSENEIEDVPTSIEEPQEVEKEEPSEDQGTEEVKVEEDLETPKPTKEPSTHVS